MAVFDVGPVLEVVTSLQGKLEEAIKKSKLLLEAIEGSQSKYTELNSGIPVVSPTSQFANDQFANV